MFSFGMYVANELTTELLMNELFTSLAQTQASTSRSRQFFANDILRYPFALWNGSSFSEGSCTKKQQKLGLLTFHLF